MPKFNQVNYPLKTAPIGADYLLLGDTQASNDIKTASINSLPVSTAAQTLFDSKQAILTNPITGTGNSSQIAIFSGTTTLAGQTAKTAFNQDFSITLADIQMAGVASLGTNSTLPRSDHTHPSDTTKEPTITSGTTSQYLRGDKSWRDLSTDVQSIILTGLNTTFVQATGLGSFASGISLGDGTAGNKTISFAAASTGSLQWNPTVARVLTLPDATDTLVGRSTTETLTNKTLSGVIIASSTFLTVLGSMRNGVNPTRTSATTLSTTTAQISLCDASSGAFSVTLPATTTAGITFTIKKIDSSANAITVTGGTIDGAANYMLSSQYKYVTLISTTTSGVFFVIGNN